MVDLGTIERVSLTEVWPHEAQDFTPWLADNLDKLGEALGLDLEFQGREVSVGPFFLDILAHDVGNDRRVVIENQLDKTDHDHLGKLLTYAAGYDAGVVVWLTGDFRDEHRAALDWLNQRTGEDTAFFGVVVEAWRIGDSLPAPHFRIVAAPNTWSKSSAKSKTVRGGGAGSELGERYRAFFQSIVDTLRKEYKFTNRTQAGTRQWTSFASGFGGIGYNLCFVYRQNIARVEVYISGSDREENKLLFDRLFEHKKSIESQANGSGRWVWERLENSSACRISQVRNGKIDDDPETLKELQVWMVDRLLAFQRVFGPHLAFKQAFGPHLAKLVE